MERESNSMTTREAEREFERRLEAFFSEIFPEHAQCRGSCAGHKLPEMARIFLKELNYPADLKELTIAAVRWYERINLDSSDSINRCKVRMLTGARACARAHTHKLKNSHSAHTHELVLSSCVCAACEC
jgi:hypothetical protein